MQPRVLILSPHVHPEPHSGVGMRGHFQAVHLSARWPLTLATESGVYDVTDGNFEQRTAVTLPAAPKPIAYGRSLLTGQHYLFEKYRCKYWDFPPLDSFTHVLLHYPALLGLLDRKRPSRALVVLDTHNNEREYYESVAAEVGNPVLRAVVKKQADVSEQIIRRARDTISATVSVSEGDRNWVRPLCSERAHHFVVPNNLFEYNPTTWSGRKAILYVGSLDVTMNLQAIDWFITNVWPRLKLVAPEIEFIVAGRNPAPSLVTNLERQGIKVIVNAPTLTPLYKDALCSLIPALSGSGAKIKVCESLSQGVPVLTTSHGLVGQPAAIKQCCTERDDAEGWIEAIRAHANKSHRSSIIWDKQVEAALNSSFFGNSIKQIADYIEAT